METNNTTQGKNLFSEPGQVESLRSNGEHDSGTILNIPNEVSACSDTEIIAVPLYKSIPAAIVTVLLVWMPLFSVFFPGWIYTQDLSEVFLFHW